MHSKAIEAAARARGFDLTPRMTDMGITGMVQNGADWLAEFDGYAGLQFYVPKPVVDWLLSARPNVKG